MSKKLDIPVSSFFRNPAHRADYEACVPLNRGQKKTAFLTNAGFFYSLFPFLMVKMIVTAPVPHIGWDLHPTR